MSWRREGQPTPVFLPGEPPWTEEPGGLQSMESQRVGHDCAQLTLSYFPTQKEDPPVCLCDVSKHTGSLCVCLSILSPWSLKGRRHSSQDRNPPPFDFIHPPLPWASVITRQWRTTYFTFPFLSPPQCFRCLTSCVLLSLTFLFFLFHVFSHVSGKSRD